MVRLINNRISENDAALYSRTILLYNESPTYLLRNP